MGWLEPKPVQYNPEEIERKFVEWCRRNGGEVRESSPSEGVKEIRCRFETRKWIKIDEVRSPIAIDVDILSTNALESFRLPRHGIFITINAPEASVRESDGLTSRSELETNTSELTLVITKHHFYLRTD